MTDEIVKIVGHMIWLLSAGAMISLNEPLHTYLGMSFCQVANFVTVLSVIHGFTGGTGIAVMRLIFVVYSTKIHLGQRMTALCITLISLTCSLVGAAIWVTAPKISLDFNSICLGRSSDYHKNLFYYYSDHSLVYEHRLVAQSLGLSALILVLTELTMYVSIYKFMVSHDKSMIVVLRETDVQRRLRRNVIDLSGHIVNFAVETSALILILVGGHWIPPNYKWILLLYQVSFYGMLSSLHIGFSRPLRDDFKALGNTLLLRDPDHERSSTFGLAMLLPLLKGGESTVTTAEG